MSFPKIPPSLFILGTGALGSFLFMLLVVVPIARTSRETLSVSASAFPATVALSAGSIAGKAAIIYDPTNGRVLYAKNADEVLPLASLTKLMTAETVLAASSTKGKEVTITANDLKPDGDWGLKPGETWKLSDLLRFGLVASANDAMQAASTALGSQAIDQMNETAQNLGLSQMHFSNPTGLDVDTQTAGAYGSAQDVAILAADFAAKYPMLFSATTKASVAMTTGSTTLRAASTDVPLLDIPGLIGAKTGYTDLAGGNLVAVFDAEIGHPLVAVVLGSSEEDRFKDIRTLIEAVRSAEQTP